MPTTDLAKRAYWVARKGVVRAWGRRASERIILRRYEQITGRTYDPNRLETLTDKLFARMLHIERTSDASFTPLVDKVQVKKRIAGIVPDEHIVPTLWSGAPEDIPFDTLQPPYVVKANHNSGGVVLVRDTPDRDDIRRQAASWMRDNYYWHAREFQYLGVAPQVLVEPLLDDGQDKGPLDYRFWCFHGEPQYVQIDNHAHDINAFYDTEWNTLDIRTRLNCPVVDIPRPDSLGVMLDLARRLSAGHDFVRVDLYDVHGHVYVGELTFTPGSGNVRFHPDEWNTRMGEQWQLA